MVTSIELQVISKILTSESEVEVEALCAFDPSYYSVFREHIEFILDHKQQFGNVPDVFTFSSKYPDIVLVKVAESITYLSQEMRKNKQHIMLVETFNKLKDLGSGDVTSAWQYLQLQCDRVSQLDSSLPMDIVKDAQTRAAQITEFNKQARIPTGFAEIDKLMYGGLSTVEELLLIVARTNSGKSWICTKMMESAQSHGFPVLYYSPEMQAAFLGARFDTWRAHFQNSQTMQGKYTEQYLEYLDRLSDEQTSAFILEDKDAPSGVVNSRNLENFVRRQGIKLLIIDGLSYMEDVHKSDTDYVKYKNLCLDLFRISKKYGCAVVVAMQANRETRDTKDDKGEPFPSLYQVEGSDHPGRICTQAFAVRQIFDKHVLDIRLEKSRTANNQKPVLSYAWDVDTGNMQFLPDDTEATVTPTPSVNLGNMGMHMTPTAELTDDDFEDDDVEF